MQVDRPSSISRIKPVSPIRHRAFVTRKRGQRKPPRWVALAICLLVSSLASTVNGQSDAFHLPPRSTDAFAFPYPPPLPGEPGVTLTRRFMLDGVPELNFHLRPSDELWLVSSRDMPADCTDPSRLDCRRSIGDEWEAATLDQVLASFNSNHEKQNVIFIHGDRTDEFWARRRGKQVYQATLGNRPEMPPVRFIIWAWPSEPDNEYAIRPFKDFAKSLDRSPVDGYWLGCFLSHLPADADPLLVSYSLGTQVVLTAISDLIGAGLSRNYRLLAVAPVTRCDWPNCEFDVQLASKAIRSLHLIRNERDIAIKAFAIYCRLTSRESTTPGIDKLIDARGPTRQIDVSAKEGREHNVAGYIGIAAVIREFDMIFADGRSGITQSR